MAPTVVSCPESWASMLQDSEFWVRPLTVLSGEGIWRVRDHSNRARPQADGGLDELGCDLQDGDFLAIPSWKSWIPKILVVQKLSSRTQEVEVKWPILAAFRVWRFTRFEADQWVPQPISAIADCVWHAWGVCWNDDAERRWSLSDFGFLTTAHRPHATKLHIWGSELARRHARHARLGLSPWASIPHESHRSHIPCVFHMYSFMLSWALLSVLRIVAVLKHTCCSRESSLRCRNVHFGGLIDLVNRGSRRLGIQWPYLPVG